MRTGVIDIGTNSIHMVLTQIHPNGTFSIIAREKEMIRLGDSAMTKGRLDDASIALAAETIKRFLELARNRVDRIIAVATSAVRESSNGGEFLDYIFETCGLKVQLITGQEEARLIHLSVRHSIDISSGSYLIMDIGGGSTEFIYTVNGERRWMTSVKLGSNRLFQKFPLSDTPTKSELKKLENHVDEILHPVLQKLSSLEVPQAIIGTSGTLNALVKVILNQKNSSSAVETTVVQKSCGSKEISIFYDMIKDMSIKEREKLKDIDKKRANMFVHGVSIVDAVVRKLKINTVISCETALREGVLLDYIDKNRGDLQLEEQFQSVRLRSVRALLDRFPLLKEHAIHVSNLCGQIFDGLKNLHKLGPADRELLEYAGYLHDVGYAINFRKHHKHSHYIILNSDLPGFEEHEVRMLALLARYHRRNFDKKALEEQDLEPKDQTRLILLVGMLRLADALDRSHFSVVQSVLIDVKSKSAEIQLKTTSDAKCELYEASKRGDVLAKALKITFEYKIVGES